MAKHRTPVRPWARRFAETTMGGEFVTAALCAALVVVAVLGVRSYVKKLKGGCCGGGVEPQIKKVRVRDKNRAHYPYVVCMNVDGMSCTNCARRLENALMALDGVWAEADFHSGKVDVRMKKRIADEQLQKRVADTGYTVLGIKEGK